MLGSDLQLACNLPASVAMLAIFQLVQVPASDLQLAGSLTASVAMLVSDLQLTGSLPASVVILASDLQLAGSLSASVDAGGHWEASPLQPAGWQSPSFSCYACQ